MLYAGSSAARAWALWLTVAIVCVEAIWIIAVPPFRGIDEFDHAYRADYVARGNWERPTSPVTDGRGAAVTVRESLVAAARPVCASFEYTGPDNCRPRRSDDGLATVATGAFAYDSTYYWLIGTPALAFEGTGALLIMRVVSSLMCALVIAIASVMLRRAFGPRPVIGLLIALTPTVAYTFSILGPNGLEIAAGAASWAGLLALARQHETMERVNVWLLATAGCCAILSVLRPLGPLWLFMIAAFTLVANGWRPWTELARRSPVALAGAVALVVAAVLVAARGVLQVQPGAFIPGDIGLPDNGWAVVRDQFPVWVFQTVAAFPSRDEAAPMAVYALHMGVLGTWIAAGTYASRGRLRIALIGVVIASLVVPVIIAAELLGPLALGWQGRYALPFAVGGTVVAGVALIPAPVGRRLGRVAFALGALALLAAQLISAVTVYSRQLSIPEVRESGWPFLPVWTLALMAGFAAMAIGLSSRAASRATDAEALSRTDL